MSDKKIVKLAVIRDNNTGACPFGLMIPDGCLSAGKLVEEMTPVLKVGKDGNDTLLIEDQEKLEEIVASNMSVLTWSGDKPTTCKYANYILKNKEKVECNYGDEGAGLGHVDFTGFPAYTQYFSYGFAAVPIGFYSEHPVRNQVGNMESLLSGSFASEEDLEDEDKIKKNA
ncbi:MAG TPA: hypothetical protein VMX17_07215 [Candidatus Glassbacteria bacterium]|nr:hypothetical protein [Candidatus Glassbacteria bacterium]